MRLSFHSGGKVQALGVLSAILRHTGACILLRGRRPPMIHAAHLLRILP